VTSCAEVRAEIVAMLRGETSPETAAAVDRHLRACAACAAERESLARTLEAVRAHVQPEVSPDARLRLRAALGEEMDRSRRRVARRGVRRALLVPAALAAGGLVAWIVSPSAPTSAPGTRDADVAARLDRAVAKAGDLGPRSIDAVSRGLGWLAARQQADGTWAPSADADAETTAASTALALLAFAADGQTPRKGPHAASLARAHARLAGLVEAGFSAETDRKPVYAQALAVRAFAAVYSLDRDAMPAEERRASRAAAADAGRDLRAWQRPDGGFGYVPGAALSDASCTLFAVAALTELRAAGVLDAAGALDRAGRYLESLRSADGTVAYARPGDGRAGPALSAALLAVGEADAGAAHRPTPELLASIERETARGGDALLAWTGAEALSRHGRSLDTPVRSLLESQRQDGAWTAAADRRCAVGGDTVTTAFGVLALAEVYSR
jgi:hypothetical protein